MAYGSLYGCRIPPPGTRDLLRLFPVFCLCLSSDNSLEPFRLELRDQLLSLSLILKAPGDHAVAAVVNHDILDSSARELLREFFRVVLVREYAALYLVLLCLRLRRGSRA